MTWIKNFLNHERYTMVGLIVSLILILWMTSCESTVRSIRFPMRKLTRQQMQTEVDSFMAEAEYRFQQLNQQDAIKKLLLQNAMLVSQGGTFNPYAIIPSVAALLGIGATVDRVRTVKRKKKNSTPD